LKNDIHPPNSLDWQDKKKLNQKKNKTDTIKITNKQTNKQKTKKKAKQKQQHSSHTKRSKCAVAGPP
jgi:hypothetical protein